MPGHASAADLAACRALIRTGSRSFHAASLLLPERLRDPAYGLYGFCRLADDAVDARGAAPDALMRLRERLDRAYAGDPAPIPADRAFADVVAGFAIPRALPEALLEGFAWDAEGRRYAAIESLVAYAARVAGTVGAMMAVLMGARAPDLVARACDLGIAMQLTNIARDVGEDARAGRLYLPLAWLAEAGLDADRFLADPRPSPALAGVLRRLLDLADALYARADGGIAGLPRDCRPAIYAARLLYAGIGREVERAGYDAVTRRVVVPTRRKAGRLGAAFLGAPFLRPGAPEPALDEARFLVDAVAPTAPSGGRRTVGSRALWLLDLYERLERRAA